LRPIMRCKPRIPSMSARGISE